MQVTCPNCGNPVPPSSVFCPHCGHRMVEGQPQAAEPVVPPAPESGATSTTAYTTPSSSGPVDSAGVSGPAPQTGGGSYVPPTPPPAGPTSASTGPVPAAPRRSGARNWLIIGGIVLVVLLLICDVIGFILIRAGGELVGNITRYATVVDRYMQAGEDNDLAECGQIVSLSAGALGGGPCQLYASDPTLFQGYQQTHTENFQARTGDSTQSGADTEFEVTGTIEYEDGTERGFNAIVIPENNELRLYSIQLE